MVKENDKTATFQHDQSRPLQNFHPVWVAPAGKDALNIGHLTDVHVSARQHAFRTSRATLIPGQSPEIGPLVNASYDNLKDLMDQFGKDGNIDLLVFTGDLIDYGRNYNPKEFIENKDCTGKLWQEMNLNHLDVCDANGNPLAQDGVYEPDTERYPRSIDNVMVYSLLVDYMVQNKKPVLLTAGNHEAYTMPYGISPRITFASAGKDNQPHKQESQEKIVGQSAQDAAATQDKRDTLGVNYYDKRANAGIPADHNLTIPEATLMYGPDYARVIMGGAYQFTGRKNFNPDNLNWFYTLLTPLSDYLISYRQQCFIVLGWGDDERFMSGISAILPRATEPLTGVQKTLVEQALALNKPCTVLCSHFTLANFAQSRPIVTEGEINFNDTWRQYSGHDTGTFENNRYFLYRQVANNTIHYTLSGHSHRAGLYRVTRVNDGLTRSNLTLRGNAPAKGGEEGSGRRYALSGDSTQILVSASSGPIPSQNHQGELLTWGLDTPSGSYIHFSGSKAAEIGVKTSRVKQAKPRLAVALDFADIVGDDDLGKGVFTRFESATVGGPFTVEVNPDLKLKGDWIESISLYAVDGKAVTEHVITKSGSGNNYSLTIPSLDTSLLEYYSGHQGKTLMFFLGIVLSDSTGNSLPAHYDTSTPWTYQVELLANKQSVKDGSGRNIKGVYTLRDPQQGGNPDGMIIRRHKEWGEVPKHRLYSDINKDEYDYPWDVNLQFNKPVK